MVCVQHEAQFLASATDKSKHQGFEMPDVGTSHLRFRRYTMSEQAPTYIFYFPIALFLLFGTHSSHIGTTGRREWAGHGNESLRVT